MLSLNTKYFTFLSQTKFYLFLSLIILLISLSISADSSCTEQWSEIYLDRALWHEVGDVSKQKDTSLPLSFEFEQKDISSSDIGGAVWHPYDFSKKRGLLISFKPTIKHDESYFGNVKYPQGFAIVFTSSSTENLLGEKGSGLGYEGIMNAIAFEFDFVKQTINGDAKKPHFSVNYNINGAISSRTKERTDNAYNILLPNFYDNSLDGYLKNIIFEIEIVGKKLTVRSNREGYKTLLSTNLTEFQQLLEQNEVHIGITASMNQNKKITIEEFKVSEVSVNEKGKLEIGDMDTIPSIKAGEEVTLSYSIQSTCGEKLKIYSDEYLGDDLKLIINNEEIKPEAISFDEDSVQLKMIVTETKENIYTALVDFQGHASLPAKFIITSTDVNRLELCDVDENNKFYSTSELVQTSDFFKVSLCYYDQYGNRKLSTQADMSEIKVGFPNNLKPETQLQTNIDETNKEVIVTVPFNTFGEYKIFSEDFIESKVRYINIMPKYISPEKSEISILYDKNIIQDDTTEIYLRIKPKDNYGRNIPVVTLEKMNCSFEGTKAVLIEDNSEVLNVTQEYKDDYVLLKVNRPEKSGRYIFTPRVSCHDIESTELKCGINFETKINNCEFFNTMNLINTAQIKVFDEYLGQYVSYESESEKNKDYLYISLDEKDNNKLTEVILLDTSNSPYFKKPSNKVKASLEYNKLNTLIKDDLETVLIGNKYSLILPKGKTRYDYAPVNNYKLKIKLDEISDFEIKVKFYFLDQYMSNVDITQTDTSKISYIAFYKQNSLTIEASDTLLLFEIYELSDNKYLGPGSTLDVSKVSFYLNEIKVEDSNAKIINHNFYITVTSYELTKVGIYKLQLKYNNIEIANLNIEIIPNKEAYFLAKENGDIVNYNEAIKIGKEQQIKLIMVDKYKNLIQNNEIYNAFSKIKISKYDYFDIRLDYTGYIHINNYGKTNNTKIVLTLINGKTYTIESIYTPIFEDLDPLNSYGLFSGSPIMTKDSEVEISLYLKDKYGNMLLINNADSIDKEKINIYIEGRNIKKIIPMNYYSSSQNIIKYKASLGKNGDFEIKIFINNFPVECQACHFRRNYEAKAELTKTTLYILGNKQKIQILNSLGKENHNVGLVDKNSGYFSFYLEERDEYDNEYKETKSLTFNFEAEDKSVDVSGISICPFGSNEDEKNFFKLCSGVYDIWKQLPDGIYKLSTLSEAAIFYLYLTDSSIDSSNVTPVLQYSSVLLNTNEIYGKTDMPGSFILDLRNSNYKRIDNIQQEKINIHAQNNSLNYEIVKGPEKGLLTVFLLAPKPGKYDFEVYYDNKDKLDNIFTYYCSCGFDKKLNHVNVENLSNGNYAFFKVLDSKDNECNVQYNWNDLSVKEYANNLFSAKDFNNNNYKIETFYNKMSNTFIFYFDNHVADSLKLSSPIIKFYNNKESENISLTTNILDENHFSVKFENNKLKITPLNANYEVPDKTNIIATDFDVSLIRIINDNFKIIKNDFKVEANLEVNVDNNLLDAKGKYIYIVYYKGKELFCENCIIDNNEERADISKTKVFLKEGDDNYIQSDKSLIMPTIKNNLPFFKINIFSQNNNLILEPNSNLRIKLETESGNILDTNYRNNSNGNIYVYLTTNGRKQFWELEPMTKLILTIEYSGTYQTNYYVLDYHIKKPNSIEHCTNGAIPMIINKKDTYIKRFNEALELEIYLSGCEKDQNDILKELNIYRKDNDKPYKAELIPTDVIGGYLLFLPQNIEVSEANKYYILNKKAKSEFFELSVMPGYEVSKITFSEDYDMDETETDKLYTYFLVNLEDKDGNKITNIGRNLFVNDLNVLQLQNNLPYRLTYDQNKKAFRCQVPINGYGTILAKFGENLSPSIDIKIDSPKFISNSIFDLKQENNNFKFSMKLVDEFYKDILSSKYEYSVSFKYFTINPLTEEVFITDIPYTLNGKEYLINLNSSFPKYSIYGFIPYIGFLPQICPSCIKLNENPEYIYSINHENYIPHNLSKKLYLIKNKDYPIYLYLAHKLTTIQPTNILYKELISTDNTKLYLIYNSGNNEQIQVLFNSISFNANFVDYSTTVEIENKGIPPYIENYGFKVFTKNNLDNIHVGFFMENRDNTGKLISTQPNLVIDGKFSGIIKRISVINTCYAGIYFVRITFSKSANIEFYPKFNINHENSDNSIIIQLKAISAFPTDIVLNNREVINKNVVKFNLVTSNSYSEQICDDRLNIYMDDMNLKNFQKTLTQEGDYCSLYIKFTGETIIKSNVNNFISDINNNDRTLYNINPKFSSLTINPNVFESNSDTLSLKFHERTPSNIPYLENEVNDNKNLYVYKYITPNKIQLIKTYSGLFSSSYPFNSDQLNLSKGSTYVLIGDVVDNNIAPSFVHYKIKQSENKNDIKSIQAHYYTEDKRSFILSNFEGSAIFTDESFELYLPLLLKIKLLDTYGDTVDIKYNKTLEAKLILANEKNDYISINLVALQFNDDTLYIKPNVNSISKLLHLPVYLTQNYHYFIKLAYDNNTFYSFLSLKESNLQCPSISYQYDYINTERTLTTFSAKTFDNSDQLYISTNTPNVQQICLQFKDSEITYIINKHLDYHKIELTTSNGCTDFKYVNSYMGCFSFITPSCHSGTLEVKYDGKKANNSLTINNYNDNEVKMEFVKEENKYVKKHDEETIDLVFNQNKYVDNYFLLKVFMNGEKLEKKRDYSLTFIHETNKLKLSIQKKVYLTSIPKIKKIMVTKGNGENEQKNILLEEFPVTIEQLKYDPTSQELYQLKIQEPFDLKVGELIYFYILYYDENHACYYGNFNNLTKIQVNLKAKENLNTILFDYRKVDGYSQCEYIYRVEFKETSDIAGNFELTVEDNNIKANSKLYIAPKDIDQDQSYFSGNNTFKAGESFYLKFSGTDSKGNSINYYDLIKEFDIQLIDSSKQIVDKNNGNYTYNIRVNKDNTAFNISLKINNKDTYTIEALHKGEILNLTRTFKIIIEYGQCSMKDPEPKILPIDNRNVYFIGETITIEIMCKDVLGNIVEKEGDEIFTANIRQIVDNVTEIKYNYKKEFSLGSHLISFTPSKIGSYSIDISLNGKKYGNNNMIEINPIDKTKFSCMNKKQFDDFKKCDEKDEDETEYEKRYKYRVFINEVLGESFICPNPTQDGYLYKCFSEDSECVEDTTKCGCLSGIDKWNGYCYSSENNPIELVKNNQNKITCINKIKSKDPSSKIYLCDDGTCRFSQDECKTTFECPLGYRSCGNKCILLSESCSIQNTCSSDDVLCWDLSCAKNYDLCPTRITCPKDKVLCPDGSCQLSGHCIQPFTRFCPNGQYQCPDFSCVENKDDCKKNPVCDVGLSLCENGLCKESCQETQEPENKFRCPNGKYVDNSKLCPSDIFIPTGYIKCSNGGIALNNEDCQYVQGGTSITCPNTKPILCPDFSCVSKSSECNINYIPKCPAHKPYQCWNNECRRSFDECPTQVTCPSESPVLCQNGFCVKSADECTEKLEDKCSMYRCFDGRCVSSMELCPTHVYCGKEQIKCWNGACVNDIKECQSTNLDSCSSLFPFRCPDGSCRSSYQDCSSITICPPNLPIKCFDNSCRASIKECPLYQSCGENKISCPDGTCSLSFEECNTGITCLSGSPYLCSDNSCKVQLSDCPLPPKCSKNEVLCPNGACVSSRQNCKVFDPCESIYPIRCESNTCTDKLDKCSSRTKRCPEGYVLCGNGECRTSAYLCEDFECPKNKPFMCKEGVCVHDSSFCDNEKNGCPYNKQIKCDDGTCVKDKSECKTDFKCNALDKKLCPDGSCISTSEECPLDNGCYKDREFKCGDGTCINPLTTSCSPILCPFDAPYKCPNGNCVQKSAECSNDLFEKDLIDCGDDLIMCADGRCVVSTDYCRPLFNCENSYSKCPDGTCRVSKDLCPTSVQCPESRPYRCDNNCVKDIEECKAGLICPNGYVKCANDGLCKSNLQECRSEPNTDNICAFLNRQMCKNGRCISSEYDCSLLSDACPDEEMPYLCPNGECTNNLENCPKAENNDNICGEGKIMCSSGRCVENKKEIIISQCTNNIGCPLDKPYRCSNGDCVTSERKCGVTSILEGDKLRSNIICDSSKPYLCADKTCVSDTSFCKVAVDCPEGMFKCDNGYCVSHDETCNKFDGFCPAANPIHCPSGTCVDDIIKCTTAFNIPTCSEGEFYCTRLNKCLKNKLDCFLYLESIIERKNVTNNNIRILLHEDIENIVNPLNDEEFINLHKNKNKIISLKEEDEDPDKDKIKLEGTICYDGTIATEGEKCPIVPACKIGQYRCENGACASDKSLCPVEENYICLPGQQKCPDGLCHNNCSEVAFHGCEVNKYQCSNGQCLDDKYDCIGHSMCPDPAFPFRCITGECKSEPEECELIERLGEVKNLTYSFNKLNQIKFNFAFDANGRGIGDIEIPGNALKLEGNYSNIYLEEVSSSLLKDKELYNNSAEFLFNVSNSIYGSEGILNFENSVMSPVFKFSSKKNNIKFKFSGKIDIAHNEYESSAFYYYDYCLAKLKGFDLEKDEINKDLKDKGWECVERQTKEGQTEFQISEFGVYAVILNPLRNKINYFGDSEAKNFFVENIKVILIVIGVVIVIIALVFYIFLRVTRYRKKYHENREKILLLKQQREEYENMTTDIFGQTLGDNINGIVYKANPAYTLGEEIKKSGTSLEDEIERLQMECKNVSEQNERLQKEIEDVTKKYEQLSESIEKMNK